MSRTFPILFLSAVLSVAAFAADPPNAAEQKLREQLRAALLQARTLQAQVETLNAEKVQLETDKQAATTQAEALQKQIVADKDATDKVTADLRDKFAAQSEQLTQTKAALDKWKTAHTDVTGVAQKKETERAKLAQQTIELQRIVTDQRTKNLAMYRIGTEVLSRYEKFGLGTALAAREPFTGTMKVKLENLVQDYSDKLAEQRIKVPADLSAKPAAMDADQSPAAKKMAAGAATKAQKK